MIDVRITLFPYSCSCFISDIGVFFGTFLVPIMLIMIVNLVMFALAIRVIVTHNRKKFIQGNERSLTKQTVKTIISIIGIIVIFGLTWLFGALTISGASRVFQYLFVITNGFQGFYFFLFICIISEDGRELWIDVITFGKLRRKRTTVMTLSKARYPDAKKPKDLTLTTAVGEGTLTATNPSVTSPNYFEHISSSNSSNTGFPGDLDKGTTKKPDDIEMSVVINNESVIAKDKRSLLCEMEEALNERNGSKATVDEGERHSQHSNESDLEHGITYQDGIASTGANTDRISNTISLDGFSIPISTVDLESAPVPTQLEITHDKVAIIANPNAITETETGWHILKTSPSAEEHTTLSPNRLLSPADESEIAAFDPQETHEIDVLITVDPDIEKGAWQMLKNTPSVDEEDGNVI